MTDDSEEHFKPPKSEKGIHYALGLFNNISPIYREVSGSFLPTWKGQERNTLSILPTAYYHRIQEGETGHSEPVISQRQDKKLVSHNPIRHAVIARSQTAIPTS